MTRLQTLQLTVLLALLFLAGLATLWMRQQHINESPSSPEGISSQAVAAQETVPPTPFPNQTQDLPQSVTSSPNGVPQSGGVFVEGVSLAPDHFNPIFTTNATSLSIIEKLYAPLVGQDPVTGAASISGLAKQWSFSDDGRTLTLTLHDGLQWSDGEPLTARDVGFTYRVIQDPATASPYQPNFANVTAVLTPDDRTVQLTLAVPDCAIFQTLHQPILPAHLYGGDVAQFQATDLTYTPTVGAGPFTFVDRIGARILLQRNPRYRLGAPLLERWEVHVLSEAEAQWSQLRAGELDLISLEVEQFARVASMPTVTLYTAPRDSITFLALNLADPTDASPGRSVTGERIPQTPHPILGNRQVRQALAQGIDYATLLTRVYGSSGVQMASYLLPSITWAHNDELARYTYQPTVADDLLVAAGWVDRDGDGIRERDGRPLQLHLLTNEDSSSRLQLAQLLAAQLHAIGVDVQVDALPFAALTTRLLGQQYDLVLIGWDNLGAEPANSDFWHSRQDEPGQGANFVSFQDAEVDQWLDEARNAPDCDGGYRAARYRLVQERIHQELPYIIIGGQLRGWAYGSQWQEVAPQPWSFDYNVHRWWKSATPSEP
ncbi:MAG: hypothetical protein KDE19_22065 [Caldilineaceae bacterium]|nr:hypothetical protein [Caldilineaceae bacterium]